MQDESYRKERKAKEVSQETKEMARVSQDDLGRSQLVSVGARKSG